MKYIPLSKGYQAIVDDEDYDEIIKYRWHYNNGYGSRYSSVGRLNRKRTAIHQQLMPDGLVDHINRNPLDNRRKNLRYATWSQNMLNKDHRRHVGIYPHKNKWRVYYRNKYIGLFGTPDEAFIARQKAIASEA